MEEKVDPELRLVPGHRLPSLVLEQDLILSWKRPRRNGMSLRMTADRPSSSAVYQVSALYWEDLADPDCLVLVRSVLLVLLSARLPLEIVILYLGSSVPGITLTHGQG